MQAIILCGGRGTRLNTLYSDRPKILVPVAGRPFIEWQLEWLARMGITDIHLAGGYKADVLKEWLETSSQRPDVSSQPLDSVSRFTLHISRFTFHASLSTEPSPLGTGGGLKFVEPWFRSDPFLVLNGDSLAPNLDLKQLIQTHHQSGRPLTIAVTHIEGTGRYGTVEFDSTNCITAFREKANRTEGWINTGVYVIQKEVLRNIQEGEVLSIETDLFPRIVQESLAGAFPCPPPLLDMGTPEGIRTMEVFLKRHNGSPFITPLTHNQPHRCSKNQPEPQQLHPQHPHR